MKVVETIEAETEFNVVEDKLREADHQLVQASEYAPGQYARVAPRGAVGSEGQRTG